MPSFGSKAAARREQHRNRGNDGHGGHIGVLGQSGGHDGALPTEGRPRRRDCWRGQQRSRRGGSRWPGRVTRGGALGGRRVEPRRGRPGRHATPREVSSRRIHIAGRSELGEVAAWGREGSTRRAHEEVGREAWRPANCGRPDRKKMGKKSCGGDSLGRDKAGVMGPYASLPPRGRTRGVQSRRRMRTLDPPGEHQHFPKDMLSGDISVYLERIRKANIQGSCGQSQSLQSVQLFSKRQGDREWQKLRKRHHSHAVESATPAPAPAKPTNQRRIAPLVYRIAVVDLSDRSMP